MLTDSLFQTAGAAMEKKRDASEVEVDDWCRRLAEAVCYA